MQLFRCVIMAWKNFCNKQILFVGDCNVWHVFFNLSSANRLIVKLFAKKIIDKEISVFIKSFFLLCFKNYLWQRVALLHFFSSATCQMNDSKQTMTMKLITSGSKQTNEILYYLNHAAFIWLQMGWLFLRFRSSVILLLLWTSSFSWMFAP